MTPGPVYASVMVSASSPPSGGWTTTRTGRPFARAKSRSRWSCAGTPMTAPVP